MFSIIILNIYGLPQNIQGFSIAEPKVERNDDINPYWIEDKDLKKGPMAFLSTGENQFWKDLIDKYLFPIDEDKAEKVYWLLIISFYFYCKT